MAIISVGREMTWEFPMVPLVTLALMYTLVTYQLAGKRETELKRVAVERERQHVVRLISE